MVGRIQSGQGSHFFLLWNLLLAWMPAILAMAAWRLRRRRGAALALLGLWLLFLPNAPYIVTDLMHYGKLNAGLPSWLDATTLVTAAITGLLLGLYSLRLVQRLLMREIGSKLSQLAIATAILLCSFGVYLGRILRLNSWDALAHPGHFSNVLLPRVLAPQQHPLMLGGTLFFALALGTSYLLFCWLEPSYE